MCNIFQNLIFDSVLILVTVNVNCLKMVLCMGTLLVHCHRTHHYKNTTLLGWMLFSSKGNVYILCECIL